MATIKQAKEMIKHLYKLQLKTGSRFTVEIEGMPGGGKSEMVPQVAEDLALEMDTEFGCDGIFLNSKESVDMGGFGLPDTDPEDGAKIMTFTKAFWVPRSTAPKHGFLFLDEFRQSPHDVQKPSAELLLNGKVNESELPIEWMVISASNREKDRSGVQRELMFVSNRRCLIKITPDLDSWVEWAESRDDIHWIAIAFAKFKPGIIFKDTVPEDGGPFCTPRTFVKTQYMIDELPTDLFTEAAAGYMGEGAAAEFCSFLRVHEEIATFDEIIADPQGCKLPATDRPDAQFATMQMIAHRVSGETALPAFEYLKRMPQEFQVAGLQATLNRNPRVLYQKEFAQWINQNKHLIVNSNMLSN